MIMEKKPTTKRAPKSAKAPQKPAIDNSEGPQKYIRDKHGLLQNVKYHFNENGSVNWRAMIGDEHLYPNRGWFETRKKAVPESIEGLEDHQLLIKLSGIKEVLKLRGYESLDYQVVKAEETHAVVKCRIDFCSNYESDCGDGYKNPSFTEVANATLNNCDGFSAKFLESIAANRAFVRCVRNFLNIHIVGADEIDKSGKGELKSEDFDTASVTASSFTPQASLEKKAREKGYNDYESFKVFLRELWTSERYRNEDAPNWNEFSDIPVKDARIISGILMKG